MNEGKAPNRETELKWALGRMQALCSRREYCASDIRRKLLRLRDHPMLPEEAEQIIAALVKEKYLDDARYAGAFARDKAALTAWGRWRASSRNARRSASANCSKIVFATLPATRNPSRNCCAWAFPGAIPTMRYSLK